MKVLTKEAHLHGDIMWKNTIKKNLEEEEELATKVVRYARNELKLKGGKLETVLRIALMETEQIHGEMAEETRLDSIAGARFER